MKNLFNVVKNTKKGSSDSSRRALNQKACSHTMHCAPDDGIVKGGMLY